MSLQTISRPKKSVKLTEKEMTAFKKFLKNKTWFQSSMELQISREVLARVLSNGSGSEKTINTLRQNLPL